MKQTTAEFLVKCYREYGCEDEDAVSVYENYSGRFMYGDTTSGVTTRNQYTSIVNVLKAAMYFLATEPEIFQEDYTEEQRDDIIGDLEGDFREDSMGLGQIIY